MNQDIYLISALVIAVGAGVAWYIGHKLQTLKNEGLEEEKTKNIVNQVFGEISQKVIDQARVILTADKEAIYKDNTHKKEAIENLVRDLKKEIDERQGEIRELEKDRNKKFGDISRSLEEHRLITQELKTSTQALGKVLSNNQTRGAWGEKIIEDILANSGLIENIHYQRQTTLDGVVKPDITLLLPNGRKVAVDVKFPYAQIQALSQTESPSQKQEIMKLFEKDVKDKMLQIEKRGYINIEAGTLDYAIMFVPNEMLFSFINQKFPDLIDDAMRRKIMIVSPFTFLIVARTVMEAYKNFMVENNLRKIIKHIQEFANEWERFTLEFDKFDKTLGSLRQAFDQIHDTRYKKMTTRIGRINKYQQLPAGHESDINED